METGSGLVHQLQQSGVSELEGRGTSAYIACPPELIPAAGQYIMAYPLEISYGSDDDCVPLAQPIFAGGSLGGGLGLTSPPGFWTAPPMPSSWVLGMTLALRGPIGRGFHIPAKVQNLAALALGNNLTRLYPVIGQALESHNEVVVFGDFPETLRLPTALEIFPLSSLSDSLSWIEFLVIDVPLDHLDALRNLFGIERHASPKIPGQVLVYAPMPCGGIAECGVCALRVGKSWKFACVDGPVFDLWTLIR